MKGQIKIILTIIFIWGQSSSIFSQTQVGVNLNGIAFDDSFGQAVSFSSDGSRMAIGGRKLSSQNNNEGRIEIYDLVDDNWVLAGSIIEGTWGGGYLGNSLSFSEDGNRLAAGAYGNGTNGVFSGHVRVYDYVNGTWGLVGATIHGGDASYDAFGRSVSLSSDGSRLAIGANGNDEVGMSSGKVRVFNFVNNAWIQLGEDINGEEANENFGWAVSFSSNGNILAVSAKGKSKIRIFKWENNSWQPMGTDIDGEPLGNEFGDAISISANGLIVAIGAPWFDSVNNLSNEGKVAIYTFTDGDWELMGNEIIGEETGNLCGDAVDISGNGKRIAIGVTRKDDNGENSGQVRIYDFSNGDWMQTGEDINGENIGEHAGSKLALSLDGSTLAISSRHSGGMNEYDGKVRVFHLPCGPPSISIEEVTACDNFTWIDGITYTESNNSALFISTNAIGCTDTINLNLTILQSAETIEVISACDAYAWIDGNTYTENNNSASLSLIGSNGCDSTLTLDLTILQSSIANEVITSCDPYAWIDGNTYSESNNTAIHTLVNTAGCDSIITLDLTITTIDPSVTYNEPEISANADGFSYQWIDCNNNNPIPNETNQQFTPSLSGSYAVSISDGLCTVLSDCIDVILTSSFEAAQDLGISIYPNPTADFFNITQSNPNGFEISIRDSSCKLYHTTFINQASTTFNLEGLPAGLYIISGKNKDKAWVQKLFKI